MKICALGTVFVVVGLAFRQADIAARASIEVATSNNGASYSFGTRPWVSVEINQTGKIWLNSKAIHDLSTVDDFLTNRCGFDGSSLLAIFRCDHRADVDTMVTVIAELQKFTPQLGICLAVKSEYSGYSDREAHLGANLKVRERDVENGGEQTVARAATNDDEIFRIALEADGFFTIDTETYHWAEMADEWRFRETTAQMLNTELHIIATVDRRCTIAHLARLLDIAAGRHSDAQITIILAETAAEEK